MSIDKNANNGCLFIYEKVCTIRTTMHWDNDRIICYEYNRYNDYKHLLMACKVCKIWDMSNNEIMGIYDNEDATYD